MNGCTQNGWGSKIQLDRAILKIEQDLPSDLSLLDDAVAGIVAMIGCAGGMCHMEKVDLALREALANAMIHGNRCDQSKPVHIRVKLHKNRGLLIVVKDAGHGFDPNRLPNPLVGQDLMSNHGRGIFLIKKCMDDVHFRFGSGTAIYMRRYPDINGPIRNRRVFRRQRSGSVRSIKILPGLSVRDRSGLTGAQA